jgi:hypothetical protein
MGPKALIYVGVSSEAPYMRHGRGIGGSNGFTWQPGMLGTTERKHHTPAGNLHLGTVP